ncbi:MAG: NAD(P)/FAD-dependent oxidoreductase [Eubacteriales bacterium]
MPTKVLILGGGYAGVEAALTLNKKKKQDDLEITVIDKNDYHTLLTELHEVAGNRIAEDGIIIPFNRIFKYTDVKYVTDEITGYDFDKKVLRSAGKEYSYDYLIMGIGSTPNFYGIPGLKEHAFTLWSYQDAVKIREHIKDCFKKARCEDNEAERRRLLTFVVAGAGFTGVEMIGEIGIWVKKLCREYGVDRSEVRLMIVDLLTRVLNVLDEKNSAKAQAYMEKKLGVEVLLQTGVKEVTDRGFTAGEKYVPCATLIWAAGIRASEDVEKLDIEKVQGRRLKVDEYCATVHKGVYAIGDVTGLGSEGKPYPAMVENAIQTGHGAAMNILHEIRGQERVPVEVKFHGVMVSIGNYFAVSDIMGRSLPSWLSVLMKFFVNIHYLWEITGFMGVAKYLYHEILERRQNKNIVEQHYSTRVQAWWMVPLRVYLGAIWLYEGIKKVNEAWLTDVKLSSFFNGARAYYESIFNPGSTDAMSSASGAVAVVADAASSATSAGGSGAIPAGEVLFDIGFSWLRFFGVKGDDIAVKLHFSLMEWITDNILLANNGTQMFFQWFVVLSEILIGLCLIGGLFAFPASGVSVILNISFLMTTGLYMNTWWMLFAGIAIMAGAGRAFGLDYYAIPYLNNFWERIWKSRRFNPFFKNALDRHQ